jgi:ornithine decarboxylase
VVNLPYFLISSMIANPAAGGYRPATRPGGIFDMDQRPVRHASAACFAMQQPQSRIDAFLAAARPPAPCIVIDLEQVKAQYHALRSLLPAAEIYYAVKANPAPAVIETLAALGARFDVASRGEIDRCGALGVPVPRLSFGNTIKHANDIAAARAAGVDLFAFDCEAELRKLAQSAPGARAFARLSVRNGGADWPLTRKFGCDAETAAALLAHAPALGLRPAGVSFHVGSQQTDPGRWATPIAHAAAVFHRCARQGIELELLNLGGGLPAAGYREPVPPLHEYAGAMETALGQHFGASRPRLLIEPGRYMVADAGLLRAEVLLIADRHRSHHRWVYLNAGRYNGLAETQGESIRYRLRTRHDGGGHGPVILAGPTCDSTDIIYERSHYTLPLALETGDFVDFVSAGAYTASYASVEFNGFPPIPSHCI